MSTRGYIWSIDGTEVIHIDNITHMRVDKRAPFYVRAYHSVRQHIIVHEAESLEKGIEWIRNFFTKHKSLWARLFREPWEEWLIGTGAGIISIAVCEVTVVPWLDRLIH